MRAGRAGAAAAGRAAARRSDERASPRRSPATTPNTPGARSAQRQARGYRSSARFAFHEAAAWRSSAAESAASYSSGRPARIASAASSRRDERLVDPVARERIDEAGRVADEQRAAARRRRAELAHRQPVAAHVGHERRVDAVRAGQPREVVAQPRPLLHPAADAEVRVVALREDPAVAAGHDAELDPGRALVAPRSSAPQGTFPSSATPRTIPSPRPAARATTPLAPSAPTRNARTHLRPADARGHGGILELERRRPGRRRGSRLPRPQPARRGGVEPAALRHQDQRLDCSPRASFAR